MTYHWAFFPANSNSWGPGIYRCHCTFTCVFHSLRGSTVCCRAFLRQHFKVKPNANHTSFEKQIFSSPPPPFSAYLRQHLLLDFFIQDVLLPTIKRSLIFKRPTLPFWPCELQQYMLRLLHSKRCSISQKQNSNKSDQCFKSCWLLRTNSAAGPPHLVFCAKTTRIKFEWMTLHYGTDSILDCRLIQHPKCVDPGTNVIQDFIIITINAAWTIKFRSRSNVSMDGNYLRTLWSWGPRKTSKTLKRRTSLVMCILVIIQNLHRDALWNSWHVQQQGMAASHESDKHFHSWTLK